MKTIRLSHTAVEKYKTCPQMYKLHYVDKLREDRLNSPLFFGSALDAAEEVLLLRKKDKLTPEETEKSLADPYKVYSQMMLKTELNGEQIEIPFSNKISYLKSDFDARLLNEYNIKKIASLVIPSINPPQTKEEVQLFYDEFSKLENKTDDEIRLYNYINWVSLYQRGLLLLKAYENEIMPHITKVHSVQKSIKLENNEGDTIIGFIDLVAEWKDEGKVIFDNKTSSRKYKEDAVKTSQQLIIYGENEEHYKAGFIVLLKNIKFDKERTCNNCGFVTESRIKKCTQCKEEDWSLVEHPKAEIQVLIDELDHNLQEQVFSEIQQVTHNIKEEKFEKNLSACFQYGKPCPYYNLCHNNDSSGLVSMKKE